MHQPGNEELLLLVYYFNICTMVNHLIPPFVWIRINRMKGFTGLNPHGSWAHFDKLRDSRRALLICCLMHQGRTHRSAPTNVPFIWKGRTHRWRPYYFTSTPCNGIIVCWPYPFCYATHGLQIRASGSQSWGRGAPAPLNGIFKLRIPFDICAMVDAPAWERGAPAPCVLF